MAERWCCRPTQSTLTTIYLVAVGLNYPWELAQEFLFLEFDPWHMWWTCFRASLGDGLMVLAIFAAGWLLLGCPRWVERPGVCGCAIMFGTGLALSVGVEWWVLATGRWAYTWRMPLVPLVDVGITPVAQMLVLPPMTFRLATSWGR